MALLRWVIDRKYFSVEGGRCTTAMNGPLGVSLWKYIRRWINFLHFITFEVRRWVIFGVVTSR